MTDEITNIKSTSAYEIYPAEPSTTGTTVFSDVIDAVGTVGGAFVGGLGDANFAELLQMQIQAQVEMQSVSMESNIEKSKHETRMSAIRNIRVN
ncbi:hypothetical protein JNK13_11425 [bacterium]|nr:hypothetical protein [bacterium]